MKGCGVVVKLLLTIGVVVKSLLTIGVCLRVPRSAWLLFDTLLVGGSFPRSSFQRRFGFCCVMLVSFFLFRLNSSSESFMTLLSDFSSMSAWISFSSSVAWDCMVSLRSVLVICP